MITTSIIIPHYNQAKLLKTALLSLVHQTVNDYEVIIIDDCSSDSSEVEYIKTFIKDYKNIRLFENRENMRFVKTVNRGIRLSKGEYICILNQDTEVKENFLERYVEILESDPSICGLSCIIVDRYGNNWWSGGSLKGGFPVNLLDDFQGIRLVDFVAGTAAFYRRKVFNEIGLFDESYVMYHEDVEFGLRIKAQTDYRTCAFSDKLVSHYHVPGIPYTELHYLTRRNHIWLARKYFPKLLPIIIRKYLEFNLRRLPGEVFRLHPWLFFNDLVQFLLRFCEILGALLKRPSKITKLDEE